MIHYIHTNTQRKLRCTREMDTTLSIVIVIGIISPITKRFSTIQIQSKLPLPAILRLVTPSLLSFYHCELRERRTNVILLTFITKQYNKLPI